MASTSQPKYNYDVFLSFRGPDTRYGFISFLDNALKQISIYPYKDSEELKKGKEVSQALMKAIQVSRIAVIIFSEDYATSEWCLNEVVEIMECHESNNLIVLPVFYKVEPREVRNQSTIYGKAFKKHRETYKNEPAIVKKWEKALRDAGKKSGWEFNDVVNAESAKGKSTAPVNRECRDEAMLADSIVEEILIQLEREPLDVPMYLVGIDYQLDELKMKSEDEGEDESLVIGLWAMGGMGKTTLAKVLYNSIFRKFEGSAFLESVDQTQKDSNSMVSLQRSMLKQILNREENVHSESQGRKLIKDRLERKKVLLILDGVETQDQINHLARHRNWFGNGSRTIVTTRNQVLLQDIEACIHEVRALERHDAVELFMKCVSEDQSENISGDHVERVLAYTQHLPLALEKLGCAFRGIRANNDRERETEREGILEAFAREGYQGMRDLLGKSYDRLDSTKKEIFLHIACLFNGWMRNYVECVLGSRYPEAARTVRDLIQKSLIMDKNGILQVHVLVESTAKYIVDDACSKNPAKRSRIWCHEDLEDALSRKKEENAAVKAIVVDLEKPQNIDISPDGFENLKMLEFLILNNVDTNFRGSIRLPKELRWCEWHGCCASGLKFTDTPRKLAVLYVGRRTGETMI